MALSQMMSWSQTFEVEMDESALTRGERESDEKESLLAGEADQVDRAIPALQARLDRIRQRAESLGASEDSKHILADLGAINLPPPGRPLAWGKALGLRQEALRARHAAQDGIEQDTSIRSRSLARVSAAANRFEKRLKEIESRPVPVARVEPAERNVLTEFARALTNKRDVTVAEAAIDTRPGELERALSRTEAPGFQPLAQTEVARAVSQPQPIALTQAAVVEQPRREPPKAQPVVTQPAPAPTRVERRAFTRVRLETEVTLESDSNFYSGFAEDVSAGGLFVATHKYQPIGSPIDVTFQLGSRRVEASGVVRWIREIDDKNPEVMPGMGIQFTSVPVEVQRDILQFVKGREPLFYAD